MRTYLGLQTGNCFLADCTVDNGVVKATWFILKNMDLLGQTVLLAQSDGGAMGDRILVQLPNDLLENPCKNIVLPIVEKSDA